ncbi:SRPBCC family protein [bacterium]|nr:SRPBCC family protein [bacterium]
MDRVRHLSIYIACPPSEVYAFASDPRNLPIWAAGLAKSEIRQEGEAWIVDAPFGTAKVRFSNCQACYVMDHDVELESGVVVHNPMRVVPFEDGSEFIFTLFRQPGMSSEAFDRDTAAVQSDLATLKRILDPSADK